MRAEELCKEAQGYDCYLHYERVGDSACVIPHGGYDDLIIAAATVLVQMEEETGLSRFTILWDLQKVMKGIKRHSVVTKLGKVQEGDDE